MKLFRKNRRVEQAVAAPAKHRSKKFAAAFMGVACVAALTAALSGCSQSQPASSNDSQAAKDAPAHTKELKKVDFILDWTPNTNHTGLYVAKEKGYLAEAGIDLDIKQPPEDSTSDLIINNKAPFGIYFQDSMASKLSKGAPVVAVAAIIQHNTSGILATEASGIKEPKDLEGKKYGTWNDPTELAMMKQTMEAQGADFSKLELVPNTDSNSVTSMENGLFDAAWIYMGWDGVLAQQMGFKSNFYYFKDYAPELDLAP